MSWFGRSRRKHFVQISGAPSVGKTTVMYRLSKQPVPTAMVPTAVAVLEKPVDSTDGHKFVFCEQKEESPGASAIIYVLDYTDLDGGLADLVKFIAASIHPASPLLVLVNKQDTVSEEKLDAIAEKLAPSMGTERSWAVSACSGQDNKGIAEVEHWLETKLKS